MKQTYLWRFLVFLMIFIPTSIFAQGTVTGTVSGAGDSGLLPGASVVVKGTTNGTMTDFNGSFSLDVGSFPATW